MKTKIITILFLLYSQLGFTQKFETLEDFKIYFLENYSQIDQIEGCWNFKNLYVEKFYRGSLSTTQDHPSSETPGINDYPTIIKNENGKFYIFGWDSNQKKYIKSNSYYSKTAALGQYLGHTFREISDVTLKNGILTEKNKMPFESLVMQYGKDIAKYTDVYTYMNYLKIFPNEYDVTQFVNNHNKKNKSSSGTGFAISSQGHIVSNFHVVENANSIKIKGVNGNFSTTYSAEIVAVDKNNDLAILKINDISFSNLGIVPYHPKKNQSDVGQNIFVLGYPLTATMGEEIKLTNGIISSKSGFQGDLTTYQITAPVQPGNSGAPLFDSEGNLIGIVSAKHNQAENVGYAIKFNYLFNLIDNLPINTINFPANSSLTGKSLTEQVKLIKNFVYIIEVN
jgi:S1-C subfamily serine protease